MKRNQNYPLLLASQFLSALGDNIILAVILGQLTFLNRQHQITDQQLRTYNAIYTCVLFIPYILLAPIAGYLNDRFSKTRWLLGGNIIKICGCAIAAMSVWYGYLWQGIGYLIVGVGACLYSPAKYGILPEILPRERLVKANGTVEVLTLLAILIGPLAGAALVDGLPVIICYGVLLLVFGASMIFNLFMTPTPETEGIHFADSAREFTSNLKMLSRSPRLIRILLGTGVFWICGAVLKMNFQPWGLKILHFENNKQIAQLGLWLGIGIMAGSFLSGQLHKIGDLRATRLYGGLLAGFIAVLGIIEQRLLTIPFLILLGASAGLFLIPLNAALQAESPHDKLGKTIATQNFIENLAMVAGGGLVVVGIEVDLGPQAIFLGLAAVVVIAMCLLKIPERETTIANQKSEVKA